MKAQAWSTDFVVSAVIFVLIFALVLFTWNQTLYQTQQKITLSKMQTLVSEISDSLIRTPGFPENWNQTNVEILGFAEEENVLNATKIGMFLSMDNDTIKSVLGIENYDFFFEILYPNGSVGKINGTPVIKGNQPVNAAVLVPVERYVMFENTPAKMRFILWY